MGVPHVPLHDQSSQPASQPSFLEPLLILILISPPSSLLSLPHLFLRFRIVNVQENRPLAAAQYAHTASTHPSMQNSPADNLPSLSSSSPLNGATQTQSDTHSWPTPAPRRNRFSTSSEPATLQRRDAAARAAKALIRENVREDWTWPSPPPAPRPAEDSNLQWRERDANSSSPSPEREPDPSDPYKYENPDSLASVIQSRKRKRRRRLLDEMRWNAGLQTYVARRDAWTGGITRSSPPPLRRTYKPRHQRRLPVPLALPRPPRTRPPAPAPPPRQQRHPLQHHPGHLSQHLHESNNPRSHAHNPDKSSRCDESDGAGLESGWRVAAEEYCCGGAAGGEEGEEEEFDRRLGGQRDGDLGGGGWEGGGEGEEGVRVRK